MQSDELAVSKASLISFPTTVLFPLHFLAVWIRCGLMLPLTGQSWYYDRHYYVCAVQDKNALANYYYCASSLVTLTFSNQLRSPCVFIVLYQQEQVFLKAHLACQWVNAHVDSSLHWELFFLIYYSYNHVHFVKIKWMVMAACWGRMEWCAVEKKQHKLQQQAVNWWCTGIYAEGHFEWEEHYKKKWVKSVDWN